MLAIATAGLVARPLAVLAQQSASPKRVAVLMSTAETDPHERGSVAEFVNGLKKLGWVQGDNLDVVVRWGGADATRLEANTREAVGMNPDAILVKGAALPSAHRATSTIPIVVVVTTDEVLTSYTTTLARPTGNITGFASPEQGLVGKRLQLLREAAPEIRRVAYLRSPLGARGASEALLRSIRESPAAAGLTVVDLNVDSSAKLAPAIESFSRQPDGALVVAFNAFTTTHRVEIVEVAARYRLPAAYPLEIFARSGGLLSYGFSQDEQFRQAAGYIARILRGATPHDLPVQLPTTFRLIINLKTAKALGLAVPQTILARADEVIE